MPFVSVTRLRLRKLRYLPGFIYYAFSTGSQVKRASGNLYAFTDRTNGLVFWTVTLWESESAMRAFRNSGAHFKVMPKLSIWCDEATYAHWIQQDGQPPTWPEMYERITKDGIVSRVKFPSADHQSRSFPQPLKN